MCMRPVGCSHTMAMFIQCRSITHSMGWHSRCLRYQIYTHLRGCAISLGAELLMKVRISTDALPSLFSKWPSTSRTLCRSAGGWVGSSLDLVGSGFTLFNLYGTRSHEITLCKGTRYSQMWTERIVLDSLACIILDVYATSLFHLLVSVPICIGWGIGAVADGPYKLPIYSRVIWVELMYILLNVLLL